MIWIIIVVRELPDMGPDGAYPAVFACTFGTVALIMPLLMLEVFHPEGLMLLLSFMIPLIIYLLIGIALFFSERTTNAPIRWTENGQW